MKTTRRIQTGIVAATAALALTACGGPGGGETGGSDETDDGPITIGISLPLTGDFAEPGKGVQRGYEAWADIVNESGGLLGRQVELTILDDRSNADTVVADYEALIEQDGVDLVFGPFSTRLGVVVDTFHVWWEPGVDDQIARAAGRIASFQVCDWITPLPADSLLARGMMGDGHIDFEALTRAVSSAGYTGDVEVEIFNADVWAAPGSDVVATCARRYVELVQPHL